MSTPTKEEFEADVKKLDEAIKLTKFLLQNKQPPIQNNQHDKKS